MGPAAQGRGGAEDGADAEVAASDRVEAEERPEKLGAAAADEAGDAEDLTLAKLERGVDGQERSCEGLEPRVASERRRTSARSVDRRSRRRRAAGHHADERASRRAGYLAVSDSGAVAQDGETIGGARDFLERVRDVEDGGAGLGELADEREEAVGVGGAEAAGGLVEHEDAEALSGGLGRREGASDLDELAVGQGQGGDGRAEIDAAIAEGAGDGGARESGDGGGVQDAGAGGLDAEHDVGGDVEVRAEGELLVDHGEAAGSRVGRPTRAPRRAVDFHDASVGRSDAREDAHERALARPVLAEDGVDFAWLRFEIDAGEGVGGTEREADAAERDAGYSASHAARSGDTRALTSGASRLSRVTRADPVSMRRSTGCPWR